LPVFVLAGISLLLAGLTLRERRRSRSLAVRAMIDPLTGLPNREAFERRLEREWARSQRYDRGLGLLLLDLDDFKGINDAHGHLQGDRVLEDTATVIAARIRETDMAARLGGDEFVVLCPETYGEGLETLARSLEARLDEASIEASVGSAEREAGDDGPGDLIARADAEMYRRKYVAHGEVASEDEQPALLTAAAS
jgi:diguanylate cyclase (GGDEF)-like protein